MMLPDKQKGSRSNMNKKENLLRTYKFQYPEKIPVRLNINKSSWDYYDPEKLENLILDHKILLPNYEKGDYKSISYPPWQIKGQKYEDSWGCIWETDANGVTGTVVEHPLEKWDNLEEYNPPDPEKQEGWGEINWENIINNIKSSKSKNKFIKLGLRHGFFFLTLTYIRGYENIIYDMYDGNENLDHLIEMVKNFNLEIVKRYIDLNVDMIRYPEDLGSQNSPLVSPKHFKKYIKPAYKSLMQPAKENNMLVHMHSDGYIMDLMDDLIECGVDIISPQDLVNGIDNLKEYKGRICIDLDIDRQNITPNGTPQEIDDLIKEEVIKLGSEEGGLLLKYEILPRVPYENLKAVMDALVKYSSYY